MWCPTHGRQDDPCPYCLTRETEVEEIDIEFNHWFNQAQPIAGIVQMTGPLTQKQITAIRNQIRHGFTHGFARGVAAEVAKPLPDHPQLGPVR